MASGNSFFGRLFGKGKDNGDGKVSNCCGGVSVVPEDDVAQEPATVPTTPLAPASGEGPADVLVITGSCCSPAAKPFDAQAIRVVDEVVASANFPVNVRTLSATDVMNGALPTEVVDDLGRRQREEDLKLPVLMVNGEVITGGRVDREHVGTALGLKRGAEDNASARS